MHLEVEQGIGGNSPVLRSRPESRWILAAVGMSLLLAGCAPAAIGTGTPNALDVRGRVAAVIAEEWWVQFGLGTAVFLVVTGILLYLVFTSESNRLEPREMPIDRSPVQAGNWWIWIGGVIVPVVILGVLLFFSMRSHIALASPPKEPAFTVEVIGHRWWWEVRYPELGIVSANEIHLPLGEPVEVHLTSNDVIHSFWVPQITGKLDLNPGVTNTTWVQADIAGIYRGICAEYCGLQHANMQFLVVAEPRAEWEQWRQRESQAAPQPADDSLRFGRQIFLGSSCVYCHTVRGTNATAEVGPDLTHLASRLTLAAGILENNRGNLAGWIIDPQHIKPGNLMPPTNMSGEELQALLMYLDSLH